MAGRYYDVFCNATYAGTVFVPNGAAGPAGPIVDPLQLAQQATDTAPFKPLTIRMSPPPNHEAVNFPIFLSISGYTPITASASAGGVTSTVTIVPTSVTWHMGDGHTVTCNGAGVPYDPARSFASQLPPPCGYRYTQSSANQPGAAFTLTAIVHFHATWTVSGAPGGGDLGTIDRRATQPVTVGEIQVLNN